MNSVLKLRKFILFILLFKSITGVGQISTQFEIGFKKGFEEGYCYEVKTVDCFRPLTPLAPLPKINESKDNYRDGYNRGFQYGLDLYRAKKGMQSSDESLALNSNKYNSYISQLPITAIAEISRYRNAIYESRQNWIQNRINQLWGLLNVMFNENTAPPSIEINSVKSNLWQEASTYSRSITQDDIIDNIKFSLVQMNFSNTENKFYENYRNLIIQKQTFNSGYSKNPVQTSVNIFLYRSCNAVALLTKVSVYQNGVFLCKLGYCGGASLNITQPGSYTFSFKGGGCFTSSDITLNISPGQRNYYIRYDIGGTSCSYSIVGESQGESEYNSLKRTQDLF